MIIYNMTVLRFLEVISRCYSINDTLITTGLSKYAAPYGTENYELLYLWLELQLLSFQREL